MTTTAAVFSTRRRNTDPHDLIRLEDVAVGDIIALPFHHHWGEVLSLTPDVWPGGVIDVHTTSGDWSARTDSFVWLRTEWRRQLPIGVA